MSEIGKLVFDHTVSKLDAQRVDLSNIRNQAAMSLAMTGLIATFFATILAGSTEWREAGGDLRSVLSILLLMAAALFALSIGFAVVVVVRFEAVTFSFDGPKMFEEHDRINDTDEFYRGYANDGAVFFKENEEIIANAQNNLWMAMVFGWSQVIPWVLIIWSMFDV